MELFAAANYTPIEIDGVTVHPMFRSNLAIGDRIRVTWMSSHSPRVQGLSLRLRIPDLPGARGRGGLLEIEGVEAPTLVFWMDTAPPVVEVSCVKLRKGAQLRISNRWRAPNGREDEWFNNYGMLIEELGSDSFVLRCSDGYGDALTFDDLVVRIEIMRAQGGSAV